VSSLWFLELANRSIPLGTAYAIWTGIGAIGTVTIGMIWFDEPATLARGLLILGIVGCVIGLKLTSGH
jgi:quaternary ammonium compound-resistance protein SugE